MCIKLRLVTAIVAVTGFLPSHSYAENGKIKLENGIDLTPSITLGYWNNDNIIRSESNRFDSGEARVGTGLLAELKRGRTEYRLSYEGTWGSFNDSSTDNYDDHRIDFGFDTVASEANDLSVNFHFLRAHEDRGQGLSQGTVAEMLSEPVEYENSGFELDWVYHFLVDRLWLEATSRYSDTEFKNTEFLANGRDRDELTTRASINWRAGTGSSFFVQARHILIDYDDDFLGELSRDGDDYQVLAGLRWQRGDLGYGTIGVGYQNKQFDEDRRENFTGFSYEVGLAWNPLERLGFELESSRASVEPPLDGDYIRQISHALSMDYQFSERVSLSTHIDYLDQNYVGFEREEERTNYGVSLVYSFQTNILLSFIAEREDNDSSLENFSYKQNLIGLEVTLGLK